MRALCLPLLAALLASSVLAAPPTFPSGCTSNIITSSTTPTYTLPEARDENSTVLSVDCQPASGSSFVADDTTTVTCTATDSLSQEATCTFDITVDVTAPTIGSCPDSFITTSVNPTYSTPSASDTLDASPTVTCSPASGTLFPDDTTTQVTCTAEDHAGNTDSCTFDITVDNTSPTLTCPSNQNANTATSQNVTFTVQATDANGVTSSCNPPSGTIFDVGTTQVTCSATDTAGNSATDCTFDVIVSDTTDPVLGACPSGFFTSNLNPTFPTPTATDESNVEPSVVCSPASGSSFAADTATVVTCTATDGGGNEGSCTFTVTTDNTNPTLTCPSNQNTNTATTQNVTFTVQTTDTNDVTSSCNPPSGTIFDVGTTQVTCSATDVAGNSATDCTFDVTVEDTTNPVISPCPDDQLVNNLNPTFATPSATDESNVEPTVVCSPASGDLFDDDTGTTVTCTATDGASNSASCSFLVTTDTTPPSLTCPSNIAVFTPNQQVTFTEEATDANGVATECTPASESTFDVGVTQVTCTATDGAGNTATPCNFDVNVTDATPPTFPSGCPADVNALASAGTVTFTEPAAADESNVAPTVECDRASGTAFAVGTTTVTCTATDSADNTATCTFDVIVSDDVDPVISSCPSDIVTFTASGSIASWTDPTSTDNSGSSSVVCAPASGSTFSIGDTIVTCTASDDAGNTDSCSFTVTNEDNTNPTITCPDDATFNTLVQQQASYDPTSSDNDAVASETCTPPSGTTFDVGSTQVTCSATDTAGNSASCQFTITIEDDTAPTLPSGCPNDVSTTSTAGVSYTDPLADDESVSTPAVVCSPASGTTFGIGTTTVDCVATDDGGNTATCSFNVTVTDDTVPVFPSGCPTDVTTFTSVDGLATWVDPSATDNSGSVTVSCLPASGHLFSTIGDNTVTCTAEDDASNTATCEFTVTVEDDTNPVIDACPIPDAGAVDEGSTVTWVDPTATDNSGSVTVTCNPTSGSFFDAGESTVTCTATDPAGNTDQCTFTATVSTGCISVPTTITSNKCTEFEGDVQFTGALSAAELDFLANIQLINGALRFVSVTDSSVPVLSSLVRVDGELEISTSSFTSADSFPNLADVQGITISSNSLLTGFSSSSFSSLTSINGSLTVQDNGALGNLEGLMGVSSISGSVSLTNNGLTTLHGLASLTSVDGSVSITTNTLLTTVGGLNALSTIGGDFTIDDNDGLQHVNGLVGLTTVGGALTISNNLVIVDVDGLNALTSVGSTLTISFNAALERLDGLNSLTSTGGQITIEGNTALTTLGMCALTSTSAGDIVITDATALCCDELGNSTERWSFATVSDAATSGCDDTCSVIGDCTVPDITKPQIGACPDAITSLTAVNEFTVTFTAPTATDNSGTVDVTCTKSSGDEFTKGQTLVTCTAADPSGNTDTCSFTVTVVDDSAPVVTCPDDTFVTTTEGSNATFVDATATDNVDGPLTPTCNATSGAVQPIGVTVVQCSVSDAESNEGTCTFTITVVDDTPPTVTCPSNIELNTATGQTASYSATGSDNGVDPTVVCTPTSGSTFEVGDTFPACTATDAAGLQTVCQFQVVVIDNTAPVIEACPADFNTTTEEGVHFFTPNSTDESVEGSTVSCSPASGTLFSVGTTVVTCTATDAGGNTDSCSFQVQNDDTSGPVITGCPSDQTVFTEDGSVATWTSPVATDNVDGPVTVNCDANSGDNFQLGTTTVTCGAVDSSDNVATCSFVITVVDNTPPELAPCPATVYTSVSAGGVANYSEPTATDNSGSVTVSCSPVSGTSYALGSHTVTCTATDPDSNTDTCSFNVIVRDITPPGVTRCPDDQVELEEEPGIGYKHVCWRIPKATDNVEGLLSGTLQTAKPPGSKFLLGTTQVKYKFTDGAGNVNFCNFTVTVIADTEPPTVVYCPSDITVRPTPGGGLTPVSWEYPRATDNRIGVVSFEHITSTHNSGDGFPVGTTTVTYTFVDDDNNTATCSFDVTVQADNVAPQVAYCPSEKIYLSGDGGPVQVWWNEPTAHDDVDGILSSVSQTHSPGDSFDVGVHTVQYVFEDGRGNQGSCDVTVRVGSSATPCDNQAAE